MNEYDIDKIKNQYNDRIKNIQSKIMESLEYSKDEQNNENAKDIATNNSSSN